MSLQKLPSATIKLIGSTQVITSVSSAVKELVENSIDAGASCIEVHLHNYGLDKIEVKDDGCGIPKTQIQYACLKSYTSKISQFEDLENLTSYGFRGEALNALCSLGQVTVTTIASGEELAYCHVMSPDGTVKQSKPSHITKGTVISVEGILRRVPVRRQHAAAGNKKSEELRKVEALVKGLSAVHPDLRVIISHDKCTIWVKSKCHTLLDSVSQVVPHTVARQFHYIPFRDDKDKFDIILPKKDCSIPIMCCSSSNEATNLYINLRPISDRWIEKEVQGELFLYFGHHIPSGKYPYIYILIHLPPKAVDINLEPNKTKAIITDSDQLVIKLKKVICDYYCAGKLIEDDNVEEPSSLKRKGDCEITEMGPCEKVLKIENNELITSTDVNEELDCGNRTVEKPVLDVNGKDVSSLIKELTEDMEISFDAAAAVTSTQLDEAKVSDEGFESDSQTETDTKAVCKRQLNITGFLHGLLESSPSTSQEFAKSSNESKMSAGISEKSPVVSNDRSHVLNGDRCGSPLRIISDNDFEKDDIRVMSAEMNDIINENMHLIRTDTKENEDLENISLSQWSRGQIPRNTHNFVEGSATLTSGAVLNSGIGGRCTSTARPQKELDTPSSSRGDLQVAETSESIGSNDSCLGVKSSSETRERTIASQMGMKHMIGFSAFAKGAKAKMLEESPGMSFVRVISKLASDWKSLVPEEKKKYEVLAKEEKTQPKPVPSPKCDLGKPVVIRNNCYDKTCYMDVSLEDIKQRACKRRSQCLNDAAIFGHLEHDVHLLVERLPDGQNQAQISAFSSRRLAEVLMFYKNMLTLEISSKALDEPVSIKQTDLDKQSWEYLTTLPKKMDPITRTTVVSDEILSRNGFTISVSQDECGDMQYQVTNVAAEVSHVGLDDLQELLRSVRLSRDVAKSRPLKIRSFLRSDTVRYLNVSPAKSMEVNSLGSSINFFLKDVKEVLPKCPHHRLILKPIHAFKIS